MGIELVGMTLGTLYLGQALDNYFGFKGILTVLVLLLGVVGWFIHLIYLLKRIEKSELGE